MFNIRPIFWIALVTTVVVAWGSSEAETRVHGVAIPTAEGPVGPTIGICGPVSAPTVNGGITGRLADRRFSGTDNRTYGAALCFPVPTNGGPRGVDFTVPEKVVEAIEVVEHYLILNFNHDSDIFSDNGTEVLCPAEKPRTHHDKPKAPAAISCPGDLLASLDVIAAWVESTPEAGLRVSGHTDATGSSEYNQELSRRRALAIKALFVIRGVESERIHAFWFGEDQPLVAGLDRQRENRRVEIEVFRLVEEIATSE